MLSSSHPLVLAQLALLVERERFKRLCSSSLGRGSPRRRRMASINRVARVSSGLGALTKIGRGDERPAGSGMRAIDD
jgi:hypothetical protein